MSSRTAVALPLPTSEPEPAATTPAAALRALLDALEAGHRAEQSGAAADLDQLQALLRHAIATLQRAFAAMDTNSRAQRDQLAGLIGLLDGSQHGGDDKSDALSIRAFADETTRTLEYFTTLMAQISKQSIEAAYQMDDMIREMDTVFQMISKLDGIADTVLILGFNATLESTRAGEAGKGFGVVAREVRELARSTKQLNLAITDRVAQTRQAALETQAIIARMASNDLVVALSAKDRVDGMIGRLRQLDAQLGRSVSMVATTTQRISEAVSEAITSLQFEDIGYQLIDQVRDRLAFLRSFLHSTETGLTARSLPGQVVASLNAAATRLRRLIGERASAHKRVEQQNMRAGEVDLF